MSSGLEAYPWPSRLALATLPPCHVRMRVRDRPPARLCALPLCVLVHQGFTNWAVNAQRSTSLEYDDEGTDQSTQLLGGPTETSSDEDAPTKTSSPHKSSSSSSSSSKSRSGSRSSESTTTHSKSKSVSNGDHADDKLNKMMNSKHGPLETKWIILIVAIVLTLFTAMAVAAFLRRRKHRAEQARLQAEEREREMQQEREDEEYYRLNEREPYAEI